MTLAPHEFIRRFLIHVLPKGFHRIRHFGLFAKSSCADNVARARELLATAAPTIETAPGNPEADTCPCCGGRMIIIETFARGSCPRYRPSTPTIAIRIDTSYERGVLLANTTIDRVEARRARPRKPSAPANTPHSLRLRQPSPRG